MTRALVTAWLGAGAIIALGLSAVALWLLLLHWIAS
jgi:hypothetical protein